MDNAKEQNKAKQNPKLVWVVIIVLLFSFIVASNSKPKPTTPKKQEVVQSTSTPKVIEPTYDIPSLTGKNIDEVRAILGAPLDKAQLEPTKEQIELGGGEWNNTYKKNNIDLVITYDAQTRKIIDFFVGTDDSSSLTTDKDRLKQIANVSDNNANYRLDFVKAIKTPRKYTGVKIIPN